MQEIRYADYLHEYEGLSASRREILLEHSKVLELARGEIVLRPGQMCRHRFFVERGAVREYRIDKQGKEHNLHFAIEGWFIINADTIFFSRPSGYFIEAIEPTRLRLIEEETMQELIRTDATFASLDRELLYEHIQVLQHRITSLQSDSALERYLHFVKTFPEMLIRLPQALIASYLGITPESLSRIRRDLSGKSTLGKKP